MLESDMINKMLDRIRVILDRIKEICAERQANYAKLKAIKEANRAKRKAEWEAYIQVNKEIIDDFIPTSPKGKLTKWNDNTKIMILPAGLFTQDYVIKYDSIKNSRIDRKIKTVSHTTTTAKTKKKGGIRRAVVGGVLFGAAGAIVGATTAKSVTKGYDVTTTEDIITDSIVINRDDKYTTKIVVAYNKALWNKLQEIIRTNKALKDASKKTLDSVELVNKVSVADEIIKLKTLFDSGILTNDEFTEQKNKLLS